MHHFGILVNLKKDFILFLIFVMSMFFFIPNFVNAEEQVPGMVMAVESDPYYFSDGGLGIGILNFFDRPMTPYLIPGKTTEDSSLQEIYQAYLEASKNKQIIIDDGNRAMAFTVDFSGGDIQTKQTFNTFSKFTHLDKKIKTPIPHNYDNIQYGLELESLPSDDKKPFYENLVKPSINPGKKPEPFDIDIKVLTGDGSTLQLWQYKKCIINSYTQYLDENLLKVKFALNKISFLNKQLKNKILLSFQYYPVRKPEPRVYLSNFLEVNFKILLPLTLSQNSSQYQKILNFQSQFREI
jgi:hypothetical protein